MKKSARLFWVDAGLFGLLILTVLMIPPEVFSHSFVHVLPGLLLMAGMGIHVWLHREWIQAAFRRYGKMPDQAKDNARIDLALFGLYLLCGWMGLSARLMLFIFPFHHIILGFIHAILAVLLISLQTVHLIRHFKWIKTSFQAHVLRSSPGGV